MILLSSPHRRGRLAVPVNQSEETKAQSSSLNCLPTECNSLNVRLDYQTVTGGSIESRPCLRSSSAETSVSCSDPRVWNRLLAACPMLIHKVMTRPRPKTITRELDLLRQIRRRAGRGVRAGVVLGIGDDCALLRLKEGEEVAVTTDLSIAGRHFRLDWHTPESVGHRTLARGLSDLAAMGARPIAAVLSLGLPCELTCATGRRSSAR